MVKKKTCVFISGTGTNLKALIKNSNNYNFPININLVFSNNKNAKGLNIAKLHKIPYRIFNLNNRIHQELLLLDLKKRKISLICLAGYMKILSKFFINKFKGKIINIHPSLLPKYKGLNTFSRVLKSKDKYTGCTVHYVNEKLDSGKIILKKKVYVEKHDNENTLKNKVQQKEYQAFSEAVIKIYN
jgi:phosphoribosylglycinamide formyltransferase 1